MGDIVLLDEATINKIAAGEVVDRPSSIVKELVENSLDAGATKITVEIKNGGISYIKITDNGKGFASDDVELAFERHATSKIRKEEDIHNVKSMGFRGEALASVAAISKVTLTTKNANEATGIKAQVEAGNILSIEKCGASLGTIIEIRDVFFNVPARFKFLKKDFTEAGYIEDVVQRLSLANPNVAIKLISNGKQIISTLGKGNVSDTVYDVFGKEIYQNLLEVNYEYESMKVTGVIGKPAVSRSTRQHQFTYINSRYVKDKIIASAIDRACLQKYAIGKFAFAVINLEINPKHVDVNVHPSKLEVKFDDEASVFEAVYHSIKNSLEQDAIKNSPFTRIKEEQAEIKKEEIKVKPMPSPLVNNVDNFVGYSKKTIDTSNKEKKNYLESDKPLFKAYVAEENTTNIYDISEKLDSNENKKEEEKLEQKTNETIQDKEVQEIKKVENVTGNVVENVEENKVINEDAKTEEPKKDNGFPPVYKYVGHLFDTYILIQINDKMYVIDQHAAHERYLYEQIKKDYFAKKSNSQLLLLPILIELSQKEFDVVEENMDMIKDLGFELEKFGDKTIKISGVPNIGYDLDYKSVFLDTVDELMGTTKTSRTEREDRFIATLACKAAVKGNMDISYKEQIALIDNMVTLDNPFNCPHGRPTAFEVSKYEIERRFLRK